MIRCRKGPPRPSTHQQHPQEEKHRCRRVSPRNRRSTRKNVVHLTIHTTNPGRPAPTSRPRMFALHHRNHILQQPGVPSVILDEIVVVLCLRC